MFRRFQLVYNTGSIKKENLILVCGFGTNSKHIGASIEYLRDFFNVYFIDLPGFLPEAYSLSPITLETYTQFTEIYIRELKLKDYILGGISFGFLIANSLKPGPECKAIIAIEPYVGIRGIQWNKTETLMLYEVINIIEAFGLSERLWRSEWFALFLKICTGLSAETCKQMIHDERAKAFFETAKLLLSFNTDIHFHDRPYVLMINKSDDTIAADKVIDLFSSHTKNLYIIPTKVEHYPFAVTKQYMEERIDRNELYKMIRWVMIQ